MGKRYYCDFCNKSIPSNIENIKKHNEGSQHQTARSNYYLKYKDLSTILLEEREKKPCSKYFTSGKCAFGILCRGSHRTQQEIENLEYLYRLECHKKTKLEEENRIKKSKRKKLSNDYDEKKENLTDNLNREEEELLENYFPKYDFAKKLKNFDRALLPPSLAPPSFKDFLNYETNDWN